MKKKKTLNDIDVSGKRVLVRVDFNVPLRDGEVADDTRIRAALPTIGQLRAAGARVILVSHLGRPGGRVDENLRLDPVARRLEAVGCFPVKKVDSVVGAEAADAIARLEPGGVLLLENVRFEPGEKKNDPEFCRELAALADVYVNDAFGAAHRAHASTAGVARFLPSAAGFLLGKEISALSGVLDAPRKPFLAVLGGAKVSDKVGVIRRLAGAADVLFLGGGMANTFLSASGISMGRSLVDGDGLAPTRELLGVLDERGVELVLPRDLVVAERADAESPCRVVPVDAIPPDMMAVDIGPATRAQFESRIAEGGTVVWNGPMGVYEVEAFSEGTNAVARAMARASSMGAVTVVGGGDSAAAVTRLGLEGSLGHVSTGGGAALAFIEGRELPGIACLDDAGRPES